MLGNFGSGSFGNPPGSIKAPARKSFADPEIADKILEAPWVRGDNSWLGQVGSKDIIAWAVENKKMIEGGRGEPVNPIIFCTKINRKVEGKDPIIWAIEKQYKFDVEDPIVWAVKNNKLIEEKHPVAWAAKSNYLVEALDPIIWAFQAGMKIIYQDPTSQAMKEVDAITWAVENSQSIENRDPRAWAIDNNKPIAGKDPLIWFKELAQQEGRDLLAYMLVIGVSNLEKMQDLIDDAIHKPDTEQLKIIGSAIIEAKPDIDAIVPALTRIYVKKKGLLPKPKNLVRFNTFMDEIDKNIAGAYD